MKLVFKKNEAQEVAVTMFKGTSEIQFSYIEMIKALLAGEPLDRDFDENFSEEEQAQINAVLQEIENTSKENNETEPEAVAQEVGDEELPF
jgi:hypothetical protein